MKHKIIRYFDKRIVNFAFRIASQDPKDLLGNYYETHRDNDSNQLSFTSIEAAKEYLKFKKELGDQKYKIVEEFDDEE